MIAAGIAAVLVTGVQPLAQASTPWEALSPLRIHPDRPATQREGLVPGEGRGG